jgi:hypothetical protein
MRRPVGRRPAGRLVRAAATTAVVAGTATVTAGAVNRHQQQRAAEKDAYAQQQAEQMQPEMVPMQPAYAAPPGYAPQPEYAAAPPPAATSSADRVAELQQLAELHNQGVLTDPEFEHEKQRILNS